MSLPDADHELVTAELGREPTPAEAALFENLWSEHCAYRSSRPLLGAFDSEGDQVVIGPGDDAAVIAVPDPDAANAPAAERDPDDYSETYITLGIESHNHPSYVDPYDGAATGIGGIVRDTLSMGAYPIALADSLYFGDFGREHAQYLFEGVVEGISDYGNAIGVPTVAGSVDFHADYNGNPLVNVACVGLTDDERIVTAEAQQAGNKLLLFGNATGRDGLGGASFASEDLDEDAETEDRPAVQVGDPYSEKLLIEASETLIEENLIESARDLGAAGLGGASSELVAKGGFGADIDLQRVHQREPNMNALEILLAESQERMCYEVAPENVDRVAEIADRFDLGCSVIGEVTEGNYTCTFAGSEARRASGDASGEHGEPRAREVVVDVDPEFLAEGAPMNDLDSVAPEQPDRNLPDTDLGDAVETVLSNPTTASKAWVYRQYDHEVGLRTAVKPGDDAAIVAIRETGDAAADDADGTGLAISSGANPNWTTAAPYDGARAKTQPTSPPRARYRWRRSTVLTAATQRSPTSTAGSKGSSTGWRRCALTSRRRWSAATSRCTMTRSLGRSRRRRRWRWSARKPATTRRRPRSAVRASFLLSVTRATPSVARSISPPLAAATPSRRCRTIPLTVWRRSLRSLAPSRRLRPTT